MKTQIVLASFLLLLLGSSVSLNVPLNAHPSLQQSCGAEQFQCANGECIDEGLVCNEVSDCADGSDEDGCTDCFRCLYFFVGTRLILGDPEVCDNPSTSTTNTIRCPGECYVDYGTGFTGGQPVLGMQRRCVPHASGGCVEGPASFPTDPSAPPINDMQDARECCEGPLCVPDCSGEDQFQCVIGQCIEQSQVCDSVEDCVDGSDEVNCENSLQQKRDSECDAEQFQCGSGECIDEGLVCNEVPDCVDGSDEDRCIDCFRCAYLIVGDRLIAGRPEVCDNPSTEITNIIRCPGECFVDYGTGISEGQTVLGKRRRCVPYASGGCVEGPASFPMAPPGTPPVEDQRDARECCEGELCIPDCSGDDQFQCAIGQCADEDQVCDSVEDCVDGSDEVNCDDSSDSSEDSSDSTED